MNKGKWIGFPISLIILFLVPVITQDAYIMYTLIIIFIWSSMAVSLGLVLRTGIFNLAHAAFMAVGAYTTGFLSTKFDFSFWLTLPIAGAVAIILAVLIGVPILRVKGMYFVLVTGALCEVVRLLLGNFPELTGGYDGISGIPPPRLGMIDFSNKIFYYYLVLIFMISTMVICYKLWNSQIGKILNAIAASEILIQSLGVPITSYKVMIFAIASFIAALCGSFLAPLVTTINPDEFTIQSSINVFLYVVLGGVNAVFGPAIGVVVAIAMNEALRFMMELTPVAFGIMVILIILFLPQGLVSLPGKILKVIKTSKRTI